MEFLVVVCKNKASSKPFLKLILTGSQKFMIEIYRLFWVFLAKNSNLVVCNKIVAKGGWEVFKVSLLIKIVDEQQKTSGVPRSLLR